MTTFKHFVEANFSVNSSRNNRLPTTTNVQQPSQRVELTTPPSFATRPNTTMPLKQVRVAPSVTQRNIPTQSQNRNGRLSMSELKEIAQGHFLRPDAAQKFFAMKDAARRDGINLSINNAYRSYEQQVAMANKYGLYSRGGRAAVPGTSNHGWGTAIDLNVSSNTAALNWLRKNAANFGFRNIPREPWHWELA